MSDAQLDRLGPLEFERLCQTLLVRMHGAAIEAWGGHGDLGVDALARRSLRFPDSRRVQRGPFVFQAKFVESAAELGPRALRQLLKTLGAERVRIERRVEAGHWVRPRHYVVMTNVRVPPTRRDRVMGMLAPVLPRAQIHLLDATQLNRMIAVAGDDLRTEFPAMLGVGDVTTTLEGVVSRDLATRSQTFLQSAQQLLPVFVATEAYMKTFRMLTEHGFTVLTGPPEVGKTSIAKMVALVQAAKGWDVIECRTPEDFERSFGGRRPQLCVTDDVFGSTEYETVRAQSWAAALPYVTLRLDSDHWFVWTSRSAPLREGLRRLHLQGAAAGFPAPAEVTVDASALSPEERASMLVQHCWRAQLSEAARAFVVRHGAEVVAHPRFTPLRASQFPQMIEQLLEREVDPEVILDAPMSEATGAMRTAFATLEEDQHRLLVSLLDADPELSSAAVEAAFERHWGDHAAGGRPISELIASLEEQVLRRIDPEERYAWAHPSWRDLVIERLMGDPVGRRRFLTRAGVNGIELAVSTAGGSAGERRHPLLRSEADRKTLADALVARTATPDVGVHRRLLLAATALAEQTADDDSIFVGALLDSVREVWNGKEAVLPPDVIELYYELSALAPPLRPGPPLDATWQVHAARIAARFSRAAILEYDVASAFIQTVGRNEPRALRLWRFPDLYQTALERLLRETRRRADAAERLLHGYERSRAWERRARAMSAELLRWRQIVDRLGRYAPALKDDAGRVTHELRRMENDLEMWLTDLRVGRSDQTFEEYVMRVGEPQADAAEHPRELLLTRIFTRLEVPGTA